MSAEGSKLLLSLIDSGKRGFGDYMDLQLDATMFRGNEEDIFGFVQNHVMSYGQLPKRSTVKDFAKEMQLALPAKDSLDEPPKFYFDRMQHRNMRLDIKNALINSQDIINNDLPYEALQGLTTEIVRLNNMTRGTKLINFSEEGGKIIKNEQIKALSPDGDKGLRFGWPTLDRMSGGLVGGDVVSFVGRPAMGKTYMMLYGAIQAWKDGKVPLFVSMEMKTTPIAQRVAAITTATSINEVKSGHMGDWKRKDMFHQLQMMKGGTDFWIADGALSATVDQLQMLCQQLQPDVLFIDGAYLLTHPNLRLPRWERVSTNAEMIKQNLAEGMNMPCVLSYQLNREAMKKKGSDVGVENIAYSDSIGQLSSLVLGLFEEDSVETKLKRRVRVLKGRNGESGEFTINWRFGGFGEQNEQGGYKNTHDVMNFSEIKDEYSQLVNPNFVG